MVYTYIYALTGVLVVSLVSLVGLFTLSIKKETLHKYIFVLISLAVGALLGDAIIHLIPEALEESSELQASLLVIAGIILFFVIEKFIHWHHHGEDENVPHTHAVGKLVLFSDGVHNFTDGIIIGMSFLVSIPVGIATTLAVILHEIPQEIGDFAVLLHSGYKRGKALWLNFLSALTAVLGTILALVVGESLEASIVWILPLAAGGFIYIAVADLIPEMHKTKEAKHSLLQLLAIIVGVAAMVALTLLE